MKKIHDWHHTPLGGVVHWLGGLQFAVPILFLVAIGLGVGTFLESTQNVLVARRYVYGAWWFISVMGLMCVSLIFAVIVRYPWKKKHFGFILVHASLVTLIGAGFWSMFERVEGHLALQEGTQGNIMETQIEQLELLEGTATGFTSHAHTAGPMGGTTLAFEGVQIQVLDRYENSREEETILNDAPFPLRAIDISPDGGPQGAWVGQEDMAGPAPTIMGLKVLVLPEGSNWEPPAAVDVANGDFVFVVGTSRVVIREVGQEVVPGWTVTELTRFERAVVAGDSIAEGPASAKANVALRIKVSDAKGTTEQHIAFQAFPDMPMGKTLEGTASSGGHLVPGSTVAQKETLVIFGTVAATKLGYIDADGVGHTHEIPNAKYPMKLQLGDRTVVIFDQLARAHLSVKVVKAPVAKDNRPALVVKVGDSMETLTIPWKNMAEANIAGKKLTLHYGPQRVELPFTVQLIDFRKRDYPGTEMAMAYESDVKILPADGTPETSFNIYMNNPYVHGPWKVYQSGFNGDSMSIFSIMHDPGLTLTYIASIGLCVGVLITFYSKSLSWGHPGIPIRPVEMEGSNAPSSSGRAVAESVTNPVAARGN